MAQLSKVTLKQLRYYSRRFWGSSVEPSQTKISSIKITTEKTTGEKIFTAICWSPNTRDGIKKATVPERHRTVIQGMSKSSQNLGVKVSCSCPSFRNHCEYFLSKYNANGAGGFVYFNGQPIKEGPTAGKPMRMTMCKHLHVLSGLLIRKNMM
jgi:hypothetical protein